jgi:hypothetical protein
MFFLSLLSLFFNLSLTTSTMRSLTSTAQCHLRLICLTRVSRSGDVNPGRVACSTSSGLAHTTCCAHGGMMVSPNKMDTTLTSSNGSEAYSWMCAVCCESPKAPGSPRRRVTNLPLRYQSNMLLEMDLHHTSSREESLKCSLCPHSGGAMSPVGGDISWTHEVCRIWTRKQAEPESIMPKTMGLCALCEDRGALIKCAGSGCMVRFHPISRKLASSGAWVSLSLKNE